MRLQPGMFYDWDSSIRFEITDPNISYNDPDVLAQAFERSTTLFNELFEEEDEIVFVADVGTSVNNHFLQRKPLNVYKKYI